MKKIMNTADAMVPEMGSGMVMAYPGRLAFDGKHRFFSRGAAAKGKVALISGGGSGHEPAHGGFVGKGMLDAAVCGEIFSSPSQIQVYRCIKSVAGVEGTLLIVKNYSGDIMNFQNAALLAEMDGIKVDYVKVADDIAVEDSLYTVGRRGVAGTVLVHKIAGAAAESGLELGEVKRIAQKTIDNVRSLGFAYTSCTVPAKGTPTFRLGETEMEYGVGIHGEPGVRREAVTAVDVLAGRMVEAISADLRLRSGEKVALLINGFGATPLLELYILNHYAMRELSRLGLSAGRVFVGNFMTSIDMAGASISILRLDAELEKHLAAPCDAPAFKVDGGELPSAFVEAATGGEKGAAAVSFVADAGGEAARIRDNSLTMRNVVFLVDKMAETVIKNEVAFCDLDSHAGDGDFGKSIGNGFRQLKREWASLLGNHTRDIGDFLDACSLVIMEYCGGASGPIWGFAFKYAAKSAAGKAMLSVRDVAEMLRMAARGVHDVGERAFGRGAGVGDKTLMDALLPCVEAWETRAKDNAAMLEAFKAGAGAAVAGAEKTRNIVARMGRAGTVGKRSLGFPDAGAHALGVIATTLSESLSAE